MLTLDLDPEIQLEYLAEGAANVVYKIRAQAPSRSTGADAHFESDGYSATTPPPTEIEPPSLPFPFEGKLVRLRKNLSSTVPVAESYRYFEDLIAPLFLKENLVEQILFHPAPALLRDCNAKLRQMEKSGTRPKKRYGLYLAEDEEHGCLVTDMTCDSGSEYESFEFKPKWLAQSPNAPLGSQRCRTCALRAMRRAEVSNINENSPDFCPLDLISTDKSRVEKAVSSMPKDNSPGFDHSTAQFLHMNSLLMSLKKLQVGLDPDGVLKTDVRAPKFVAAMTLRDCTLFLKV